MKMIWPDKFKIRAEKIGEDKWKLNYIERGSKYHKEAEIKARNLGNILEFDYPNLTFKIRLFEDGFGVSLEGTREDVYNSITDKLLNFLIIDELVPF